MNKKGILWRKYLFCNKSYIDEAKGLCSLPEVEENGTWLSVIGPKFPEIEKVKDCAPYEIKEIPSFKFRQKVAKTIVIYE